MPGEDWWTAFISPGTRMIWWPKKSCEIENIDTYRTEGFVLEGGSIHVDGEGTLLVMKNAC